MDTVRPVTAVATVYAPEMATSRAVQVRVRAQPSTGKNGTYLFDWDDLGAFTTITAHTGNTITMGAIPPNLAAAFAAGKAPRVQIVISTAGASPLPWVARVTNIGGATLTLDRTFAIAPTDAVDYFWAGSAIVEPIAEDLRLRRLARPISCVRNGRRKRRMGRRIATRAGR